MKTINTMGLALSLMLVLTHVAVADSRHHGHASYHSSQHRHSHGGNAAFYTIAGIAIGTTAYRYYAPRPVYPAAPSVIYAPPYAAPSTRGTWFYCASSGQYYPYVRHCPEGWHAVPAHPQ